MKKAVTREEVCIDDLSDSPLHCKYARWLRGRLRVLTGRTALCHQVSVWDQLLMRYFFYWMAFHSINLIVCGDDEGQGRQGNLQSVNVQIQVLKSGCMIWFHILRLYDILYGQPESIIHGRPHSVRHSLPDFWFNNWQRGMDTPLEQSNEKRYQGWCMRYIRSNVTALYNVHLPCSPTGCSRRAGPTAYCRADAWLIHLKHCTTLDSFCFPYRSRRG